MRFMAGLVDSVAFQNDRITPGLSVDCCNLPYPDNNTEILLLENLS